MADDSDGALTEYSLTASRVSPKRTSVDTGDAEFVVGKDVNPVEYFLGSILACINSTGTMVARDMDIEIESLEASVDAGVNYARYKGEASEDRSGLQNVTVSVSVESDADQETLEEWRDRVEDRCPISDNVANETPVEIDVAAE
jgi:uncharacterized OsmC-like protein